jgi:hypothetical protein
MDQIVFVSSFYRIFKDIEYSEAILDRLTILSRYLTIHLVCSEKDREAISGIPNIIPYFKEFEVFETYKILHTAKRLPEHRDPKKDTKEYMILMNMKTECLALMKQKLIHDDVKYFVWLDAGISKIFKDPDTTLSKLVTRLQTCKTLSDRIVIPGCWGPQSDVGILTHCIHWRFCGGFFCVPSELVIPFSKEVLQGCQEIKDKTNKITWEVNVCAYIESRLPIEWRPGDHNETIFSF